MRKKEKSCIRLIKTAIATLFLTYGLILAESCTPYNPAFYPSYDVLNPGEAVRENPFGFIAWSEEQNAFVIEWKTGYIPDRSKEYIIIDEAMSQWIRELRDELEKVK